MMSPELAKLVSPNTQQPSELLQVGPDAAKRQALIQMLSQPSGAAPQSAFAGATGVARQAIGGYLQGQQLQQRQQALRELGKQSIGPWETTVIPAGG